MSHPCPFCSLPVEQEDHPVNIACPRCGGFFKMPADSELTEIGRRNATACQLAVVLILAASSWMIF